MLLHRFVTIVSFFIITNCPLSEMHMMHMMYRESDLLPPSTSQFLK